MINNSENLKQIYVRKIFSKKLVFSEIMNDLLKINHPI